MEDTIVLYSEPSHLDSMLFLANFIGKHYPTISLVLIGTAAAAPVSAATSPVAYHRLPAPVLPQSATSINPVELMFESCRLSNPSLLEALQEISQKSKIRALVFDMFCYPAFEVSSSLSIPTYFCQTAGAFSFCHFLYSLTIHETVPQNIGELNDFIEVPGCPIIHSSDVPASSFCRETKLYKLFLESSRTAARSDGMIANTFQALEILAMEALANGLCIPHAPTPPVYALGPLIAEKDDSAGGGAGHECLRWLDLQPSKSVIFLCFGRRGVLPVHQLKEMATGLENSGCRFLWAVRSPHRGEEPDLDALLPEGFLERTRERGLVLKSWAPQRDALSHDSVGGFVTHCGQSSLLEAVSLGVPMIGWPLYAEQRMNRVFMVEEMKVALPLEEAADGLVTASELEKRIRELMESRTGNEVRRRVTELKHSAAAAVRKGGSSVVALEKFVHAVTQI